MSDSQVTKVRDFGLQSAERIREIVAVNMGGQKLTQFDLDRVRVPAGGGTVWELPGINGTTAAKEFDGIIVGMRAVRRFYGAPYAPGVSAPPDCLSEDLMEGIGEPGGACVGCPQNQWGTGRDGRGAPTRGKACGEYRMLFVKIKGGGVLPTVVVVPPTSLGPLRKYLAGLTNRLVTYQQVVTRFALDKGDQASTMAFTVSEQLEGSAVEAVRHYAEGLAPVIEGTTLRTEDVTSGA